MKTKKVTTTKKIKFYVYSLTIFFALFCCQIINAKQDSKRKKIKIALLLDTSNSMDGLISQAKSQLWLLVNELAMAKCKGDRPELEIALYEYGNDNLSAKENYIRLVTPLTSDLDQISKDLFNLTTNGGSEFCGAVIQTAINQLDWGKVRRDLQIIFIAGNEPFTQGGIDYKFACTNAKEKKIAVNTIYCGDFKAGINTSWKHGADITGGNYMSINQDRKTVYISSPFDKNIAELNISLNATYIGYGKKGKAKKQEQVVQDKNAKTYGATNMAQRAISKSTHFYKNEDWDIVDAVEQGEVEVEKLKETELPTEMKGMTNKQKIEFVEKKRKERLKIQKEIQKLNAKRKAYIAAKQNENSNAQTLDNAMLNAIKKQATSKGFYFK